MTKNILILVENLSVPFDRRVWMEANTLQSNGYQVHVICPNSEINPTFREEINGIRIYRYPNLIVGRRMVGTLLEYAWAILCMSIISLVLSVRTKFLAIQVCNPPDILFIATWFPQFLTKAKLVFDQHDINPELWESKGNSTSDFVGRGLILMEKITYKRARKVISTNLSYKQIAMARGKKESQDVYIVRSAPKKDFAVANLPPTRSSVNAKKIVYIGTMGKQEGIDILLRAVQALTTEFKLPEIQLELIGDGPERIALQSLAAELGILKNVLFHGRVSDSKLKETVLTADIAVNPDRPSKMNDLSSMNKIVEYMALGRPIVQFACLEGERTAAEAAMSVTDNDYRSLAAEIALLLSDSEKRLMMSNYALHRFKNVLAWEFQESALLECYSSLSAEQI